MSAIPAGDDAEGGGRRTGKSAAAFRTISEVATYLDVQPHVLRFWESKFPQIKPLKRGGGRRYYRPEDVELLKRIRVLLYRDGYTIKGVQKLLRGGARVDEVLIDVDDVDDVDAPPPPVPDAISAPPAPTSVIATMPSPPSALGTALDQAARAEISRVIEELARLRDRLRANG
jgi:DNA-binding transcriptional MerR regulator